MFRDGAGFGVDLGFGGAGWPAMVDGHGPHGPEPSGQPLDAEAGPVPDIARDRESGESDGQVGSIASRLWWKIGIAPASGTRRTTA